MHARSMEMSLPAYLAMEAADVERRHEYWEGECWAMSGTTPEHNDLVRALVRQLDDQLRGGPCRAYAESIRTRVGPSKYVYPDVVVACPPDFDRSRNPPTLTNPKLIAEILSESTSTFDRGDKLEAYRRLASVEEILLADSRERAVTHHRRQADGSWLVRSLGPGDGVTLESVGVTFALDALYAGLEIGA